MDDLQEKAIVRMHESKPEPSSLVPLEDGVTFQPRCKHCQKVSHARG
jgi:hypothetical protein